MSSKWSKNSPVQKEPDVCRKPPDELPAAAPPFGERVFQAFTQYLIPGTPLSFIIQGYGDLNPTGVPGTWEQILTDGNDAVRLTLTSSPPWEEFNVSLEALRHGVAIDSQNFNNVEPRSMNPFRLPMQTYTIMGGNRIAQTEIMA